MGSESVSTHSFLLLNYGSSGATSGWSGTSRMLLASHRGVLKTEPAALELWFFMPVESGLAFAFLQFILENVLTGITVIDVNQPRQLVCG